MGNRVIQEQAVVTEARQRPGLRWVRRPQTLRASVGRKLIAVTISCGAFLVAFAVMTNSQGAAPSDTQPPALAVTTGDADRLIAKYGCWTGGAPADMEGQIPGHVIVSRPNEVRPVRGGDALVSKAFQQVFDDIDHGLTIHAFCR